jgi:Zn-dependent protease with chaperone function
MGTQGQMMGLSVGWIGYLLALGVLGVAGVLLLRLGWQGWRSQQQIQTYPQFQTENAAGRLLDTALPFAAQIGFWRSELVVSQGLLTTLTSEQLTAVLTHEQAHAHYRDTFWFFWLGWLRQLTGWLPNTEALWQELLLLRELRADSWAAQTVDPLLIAESLLLVVQAPLSTSENYSAAFGEHLSMTRLEERIEALLTEPELSCDRDRWQPWSWLLLTGMPLLTVLLHS